MVLKCNATIIDDKERRELFSFVRKVSTSYSEIGKTIYMTYNGGGNLCLEIIDKFESCAEHCIVIEEMKGVVLCQKIRKTDFHT